MSASSTRRFSIGVDFGTNSVRALVVDVADGSEIATSSFSYPTGDDGVLLDPRDPNLARQHPGDYIAGFYRSVRGAVRAAARRRGFDPSCVIGIGIDTTGSTPIPVDRDGVPLALYPRFRTTRAAQAWLWKDHTAHAEAAEITEKAAGHRAGYLDTCGGTYSSEWYWSKILHCRRSAPTVFDAAYGWVELADFMPGFVTGHTDPDTMPRGICAAGHKAMYHEAWGGLPDERLLASLDPGLTPLRRRFATPALAADRPAGTLTPDVARRVGLPAAIPVAVGALDAHMGAVGSGIRPGTLTKIIGTSTCDMMVAPLDQPLPTIPGLCGIVPESIVPGMYGLEAGQSAVGDIFNWFASSLAPARYAARGDAHANLTRDAARLLPGESGLLALDWNNGNRTVLVDPLLTGLIVGQTLQTTAPEMYRALVEATAFGALTIINRLEEYGVTVKEIVNCGGIAEKNPFVMQVYADVCNRPMTISRSAQTPALGSAIFGAIVGGAYRRVERAQRRMTGVKSMVYRPRKAAAATYAEIYPLYMAMHDAFGRGDQGGAVGRVMKGLIQTREKVRRRK